MFRLRLGFVTGICIGYYLGTMAGRERYEQLNRVIGKVRRSDATHSATDKVKSVAGDGINKATSEVKHRLHHNSRTNSESFSPS